MPTRRLLLLGIAAFVLGACSSSDATTTAVTPAPATVAATTTSAAPTTVPTTAAAVSPATSTVAATNATVTLISQALVAQTHGKLSVTDATCIATGLLAKYDITQLAAMQSGPVSAEVTTATGVIIGACIGTERAAEVGALLAAG